MRKNLLLTVLLGFLVVMNGVLIYLVLNKQDKRPRRPKEFISEQLNFSEEQKLEFGQIEDAHHHKMRALDHRSSDLKAYLFSQLGQSDFTYQKQDSVIALIGALSIEREKELFGYFQKVSAICNDRQRSKLERILSKAVRHGPKHGGPPPPPR